MRKTITIPEAGVTEVYSITGKSILIEVCPKYETAKHVPLLGFDSGENQLPIYPRSTYEFKEKGSNGCERDFQKIRITGTSESAGDEIEILSVSDSLGTNLNPIYDAQFRSVPGTTFSKSASNAVQSLDKLELVDDDGNEPTRLYISVSPSAGDGIKWAINSDPVQGMDSLGTSLNPGESISLDLKDIEWMLAFKFIAQVEDETPEVNFTPEY